LARGATPRDILDAHFRLRQAGFLEEDLRRHYRDDCVVLSVRGARRGLDAMREEAALLAHAIPDARFELLEVLVDGRVALLEWRASGQGAVAWSGADSYVFDDDGRIAAQTIHYEVR